MKALKTGICPVCNQEFSYYPSGYRTGVKVHCSKACLHKACKIQTTCPECGKAFWYDRSWPRKYCSRRCAGLNAAGNFGEQYAGNPSVDTKCDSCGRPVTKMYKEFKKTKHHFCSRACFAQHLKTLGGEQTGNWKGGYEPYYGPNWRSQRRNARKRDNYTCQRCGISESEHGRNLDVHHIIPFRKFGIERYKEANALSNLLSLCVVCHTKVEHNGL